MFYGSFKFYEGEKENKNIKWKFDIIFEEEVCRK